jgi:NAD(P)-dependent dehydrogenase (short-subunit alcohol dehydrogenase family)
MRFAGKCAVITGAASGIGRATALLFAEEGAHVIASDFDAAGLDRLVGEAPATAGTITPFTCDVCDTAQIKALMDFAAATHGGIDVVFNNAGAGGDPAKFDEIEPEGWDRTMDLLLRAVAMGVRYAVPHMKGRPSTHTGGAAIVNTSSVAAIGSGYSPSAYAIAKAGVLHMSKLAAADLAKHGIRVNSVQPGFINTNIFTSAVGMPEDRLDTAKAMIAQLSSHAQPVARGGQPRDIAEAVAFLASEAAGFVNGTSLIVDGGLTIGTRDSWDAEAPGLFDTLRAFAEAPAAT